MHFYIFNAQPEARGFVRIATSSVFDRPIIDHGWDSLSSYDLANLQYGLNFVRNLTQNTVWGKQWIQNEVYPGTQYGSDDLFMRLTMTSAYHQMGTCGLGKCTDTEGQVQGVSGLRVCDASMFPTMINVNPTYTLYSMCEKLSDMIRAQHS